MQRKSFFSSMLVAFIMLYPLLAAGQESGRLAEWNMESSEEIAATWFTQGGAPSIAPDECVGDKADYVLTGWSEGRYWQLCTGYQNKVLRIENTVANDINDYTDASQHNVYYEIQFPTKGFKNISLSFACFLNMGL